MRLYQYTIRLLDSVYYAREGLTGAFTPHLLHGTALNGALAAAMNANPEQQPFLISELNGGRNKPRYTNSALCDVFYATPAKLKDGTLRETAGIAKGESDGFFQLLQREPDHSRGLQRIDARTQPLRFCQLQFLAPETEFTGFLFLYDEHIKLPEIIRLGSFRSPCRFNVEEARSSQRKKTDAKVVDHPVDPLLADVQRGTMINILPYGLVSNALVKGVYGARFSDGPKVVADHTDTWRNQKLAECEQELTHARRSLEAAKSDRISEAESAYLLLQATRGLTSIALLLRHELTQERLNRELSEIDGFAELREAVKNDRSVSREFFSNIENRCREFLAEITEESGAPTKQDNSGLLQL